MNSLNWKSKLPIIIGVVVCFLTLNIPLSAQELPEWVTKLPVKKGFVYGVGKGESADMSMAKNIAGMNGKNELLNQYTQKFEVFAVHCDTLLGPDNKVRAVVTTIYSEKQAVLNNVELVDEKMDFNNGRCTFYLLYRIDISAEIKKVKSEVEGNEDLKKQIKEKGLLDELKNL